MLHYKDLNSKLHLVLHEVEQLMSLHKLDLPAKERLASAVDSVQLLCAQDEKRTAASTN